LREKNLAQNGTVFDPFGSINLQLVEAAVEKRCAILIEPAQGSHEFLILSISELE